jgi:hypothetical protein
VGCAELRAAVCGVRADVVRACGACVVCCVLVCDVRCVAYRCALFWVTRAMVLPYRCCGWGLSHRAFAV